MRRRALLPAAAIAAALALGAAAHDAAHDAAPAAPRPTGPTGPTGPDAAPLPFPVGIEAEFSLIDHDGRPVAASDFSGRPYLLFFGYASCESICSLALPTIARAVDLASSTGVIPLLVTIDPARDTPAAMRRALAGLHPGFVGLTGSDAALAAARKVFQVELSQVADGPAGPIYAHGSFVYLVGPDGRVRTLMPPILSSERMAELIRLYP